MSRFPRVRRSLLWLMGANLVAVAGCEFATDQEAADQLRRGPLRQVEFDLPVIQDTFFVGDVFDSLDVGLDTLPGGLLAIVPDTVNFAVFIPVQVPSLTLDTTVSLPPVWETVDSTMLNLGDFADALRDASINNALAAIRLTNGSDAPVELVNYTLGVVPVVGGRLDSVGGQPAYATDPMGTPILVGVADPGDTVFALGRNQVGKVDSIQAAPLIDVLVDKVLNGDTVALVGSGDLHIGDGSVITVNAGDFLDFRVVPIVGLDLTLGTGGAGIELPTLVETGLDLDSELADDLIDNVLDSVGIVVGVQNGIAFGLQVETAFVGDSVTGDVFAAPNAVLDTLVVSAPTVDGTGRVTQVTADTTGVVLANTELRQTLGAFISFGVRIRLLAPPGGRGAVYSTDAIQITTSARVWAHVGGGS